MDLAEGHICALRAVQNRPGVYVWNLGTGKGMSVLEVVRAFENVIGRRIPYRIAPRRSGDIPVCYANPYKAVMELHWKAKRNLDEIMRDVWRWQSMNPNGYEYSQTYLKKQIEPYK
jgi:UDP-glucose 4-epimerase